MPFPFAFTWLNALHAVRHPLTHHMPRHLFMFMLRRGSHATAWESMEYRHHILGYDVW